MAPAENHRLAGAAGEERNRAIQLLGEQYSRMNLMGDGSIRDVNENLLRMTGWKRSDVKGQHLSSLLPPDVWHSNECQEALFHLCGGKDIHLQVKQPLQGGFCRTLQIHCFPETDSKGRLCAVTAFALDITQK